MWQLDDGTIEIVKYTGNETDIVIPSMVNNYEVSRLGNNLFKDGDEVNSIQIPNSVVFINEDAFFGCTSLKSIEIPDSVEYIGCSAFLGCTSLISVEVPDSVTCIRAWLFSGCTNLKSIKLHNKLLSIEDEAFLFCENLSYIEIPDSVVDIGYGTFAGCDKLMICSTANSYAHTYAINNGIKWQNVNPSVVSNFTYSARSSSTIALKWSANTDASGYIIEQYKEGKWVEIKDITNASTASYKVTGLKASTANKFRIKAYKSYGSSKLFSSYVTKTIKTK